MPDESVADEALVATARLAQAWHNEEARRPETRAARIEKTLKMLADKKTPKD
jgi:uncharacterized protein YdeI (YjbR/CyaY-like superfamily)